MSRIPECLSGFVVVPTTHTDSSGVSRPTTKVSEPFVYFMQRLVVGDSYVELKMDKQDVIKVGRLMKREGVDIPTHKGGMFYTRTERRIMAAVDNGVNTVSGVAKNLNITYDSAKAHVYNIRHRDSEHPYALTLKLQRKVHK